MIYTIVICAIFFCAAAMWLIRFFGESGFKYPNNRYLDFIMADNAFTTVGESSTRNECIKIFLFALIFRIFIFLLGWLAYGIFSNGQPASLGDYCNSWNVWDAPHFIDIAQNGYGHAVDDGRFLLLVFFPIYPLLIKFFNLFIGNYAISGLIISTLFYSLGCVIMYKLVIKDYNKSIARKSIIFLSVYPFAFYYGGIMTESTFFLVIMLTFLAIREHKWVLAGIFGAIAALTRSFGVLMIIVAAVEWCQENQPFAKIKDKQWKKLGKTILTVMPILIIPLGTLIYLYINYYVAGDALIFAKYQEDNWSMHLQFFGKTLHFLWRQIFSGDASWTILCCLYLPEFIVIPLISVLILYSVRRTRSMYVAFVLMYFIFNVAASWPLSVSRYLACMFPIFWIMGEYTERHKGLELPLTAIMAIGFGIYLTGYITLHQIM